MRQGLVQKLLLLMLAVFSTVASAEVFVGEEIEVELVSESANVVPGETLWTAVRLKPTEGWHTYSKWPGDSGDATMIHEWQLPEGASAGDIHWPVPSWLPFPGRKCTLSWIRNGTTLITNLNTFAESLLVPSSSKESFHFTKIPNGLS